MKNLKNALLLKQLYQLKRLGYQYTSANIYKEDESNLELPNTLETLKKQALSCHLCALSKHRTKVVFGEGKIDTKLMIIGDMPYDTDDTSGKIFTGRSGELLTKMIENVLEIKREDIYISNILKCKPLNTQTPSSEYCHTCYPYILKEIEIVKPSLILTLGELPYSYLSKNDLPLAQARGIIQKQENYTLISTYHPSYLLRNPSVKKEVYEDLLKVKTYL